MLYKESQDLYRMGESYMEGDFITVTWWDIQLFQDK